MCLNENFQIFSECLVVAFLKAWLTTIHYPWQCYGLVQKEHLHSLYTDIYKWTTFERFVEYGEQVYYIVNVDTDNLPTVLVPFFVESPRQLQNVKQ